MLKNIHEANLFRPITLHRLGAWSLRQALRHIYRVVWPNFRRYNFVFVA